MTKKKLSRLIAKENAAEHLYEYSEGRSNA